MKPGKPLRRRTGLRPGGPLVRRTELRRTAGLNARSVKPGKRAAERAGKDVVHARSGGLCEACGQRRAAHWHHRVNRGQGGSWAPQNGMHVCVECHAWIGDFPTSAGVLGWHLKPNDDPAEEPLRYRGHWALLGVDTNPPTPVPVPDARRHLAAMADITRRVA